MRIILSVLVLLFCFLISSHAANANSVFDTAIEVAYTINKDGQVHVVNKIIIKNMVSESYAPEFIFSYQDITPVNISVSEETAGFETVPITPVSTSDNKLKIVFEHPAVGIDKQKTFFIAYDLPESFRKNGKLWELLVPELREDSEPFNHVDVTLTVASEIGSSLYLNPSPQSILRAADHTTYLFEGGLDSGIRGAFGENQTYRFDLIYHLKNPKPYPYELKIAIPPDTGTQKIYYENIVPKPTLVTSDIDGNWIAHFNLKGQERIDVTVTGFAEVFAEPIAQTQLENKSDYLTSFGYWETTDDINTLSKSLQKPSEIFDFVAKTLTYDYTRVGPTSQRLGAAAALAHPESAICTEYTDLFIAIARASGIPSREIQGFAYSENPKLKPLSLVSDVLHSWPEYWDDNKKTWIPVDPTWSSTTGGADFFTTFDLRHIVFVIHGISQDDPLPPGSYKLEGNSQKDVFVNLSKLPEEVVKEETIDIKTTTNFFGKIHHTVVIKNNGAQALYNTRVKIYADGYLVIEHPISELLPFSFYSYEIDNNRLRDKNDIRIVFEEAEETITFENYNFGILFRNISALLLVGSIIIGLSRRAFRVKRIYDEVR